MLEFKVEIIELGSFAESQMWFDAWPDGMQSKCWGKGETPGQDVDEDDAPQGWVLHQSFTKWQPQ